MKSRTLLFTLLIFLFNLQGIAQPINDNCANATIATLSTSFTTYTMDFDGATSSGGNQSSCDSGNSNPVDVWFRFTTTSTGNVQLSNDDSYTTGQWGYFALYSGSCNGLVELDCDQINDGSANTERYITHFFNLNPNQNYYLRFWDNNNDFTGERDFRLRAGAEVFNDICSQSETLIVQPSCTILPNEVQLGFATLSNEPLTTCNNFIQVNYDTADVWYDFIAPATGAVSLPYGDGNSIVLILYEGNCNSLTPVFCNQTSGQGYISGLNSGQNYYLRVLDNGYTSGAGILDICVIETLPPTTNDDCDDAIPLVISNNCNNPITANFYEATEDVGNRIICGNTPNDQFGIWYSFSPTSTGAFYLDFADDEFFFGIFENNCNNLSPIITCEIGDDVVSGLDPNETYYLKAWRSFGNDPIDFCMIETTGPMNNLCSGATDLLIDPSCTPITADFTSTNRSAFGAPLNYASYSVCGLDAPFDLFYQTNIPSNGKLKVGYLDPTGDDNRNVISVYTGACNPDNFVTCISPSQGFLELSGLPAGQNALIRVESNFPFVNHVVDFCVSTLPDPPNNDLCSSAINLPLGDESCSTVTNGTLIGATNATDYCSTDFNEVFYSFTAPISGNYTISILNIAIDINIGILSACNGTLQQCATNEIDVTMNTGETRLIEITTTNNEQPGNFDICVKPFTPTGNNDNNVGIGVANPIQKLQVAGGIALGNTTDPFPGTMRFTGQDIEAFLNGQWRSMTTINGDHLGNHNATQALNMNNNNITNLSDPNSANDAANKAYVDSHSDGDNSSSNEIQNLSFNGSVLSLSDGGGSVNIPTGSAPDWNQMINIPNVFADGVDNVIDNDNDPSNELQTWASLPGKPAGFSDGIDNVKDGDDDDENELISEAILSGDILKITEGNQTINVDMSAFDHWQKDVNNDLRYFAGDVIIGNNTSPSDKLNVVNGGIDVLSNSGSTNAHLDIIETGSIDGARISFKNFTQTNNRWTLFGRSSNTTSSNLFHVFHNLAGNVATFEGDTGDLGLGGSPTSDLHIFQGNNGGTDGIRLQNTDNNTWIRMYVSSGSGDLRFYSTAEGSDIIAAIDDVSGAYSALSDRRKKQEIEHLKLDWSTFMKVNPVKYSFKRDLEKKSQVGLIAQEVQKLYPEIVNYYQEEDLYHIKYAELNVIAIKAIQDQQKTITAQNQVLQDQAKIIKSQEGRISKLEKLMEKLVEK